MPRGWEDFWGRARRIQYPTIIDLDRQATPYRSDSDWYTHREYEADLEFNIPTGVLVLRIVWTMRVHTKVTTTHEVYGFGRVQILWNNVVIATTSVISAGFVAGIAACRTGESSQDVKLDAKLDKKYMRGKIKVQYQIYVTDIDEVEAQISESLCKAEVGVYEW